MRWHLQSICQLAVLTFCYVLITVQESDNQFVPGRCLCPETENAVRRQLKDFNIYPKSAACDRETVIVILKHNNEMVCLNPNAPTGKRLIHCWNRHHNVKRCLKMMKYRGRRINTGVAGPHRSPRKQTRKQPRKTGGSSILFTTTEPLLHHKDRVKTSIQWAV